MAQTSEPGTRPRGNSTAANGASGANGTNGSSTRRGFSLSSLSGLFGPRPASATNGANGASQTRRPSTGMGSFLKGWLLLVVGMYVLQILLYIVDANFFHSWLELHYIAGSGPGGTKPGSAFLLGGTTWYLLIFVALFALLYYVLVKFKILPKDLFGSRSQAQANARAAREARDARNGSTTASVSPPPLPSGVNPYADRSRAARRDAQRRAAAAAEAAAAQPKRGLFGRAKPQPTVAPAASASTKKPARELESSAVAAKTAANAGDSHYQRVRAGQRQRKRRAAKR